MDHEQLFAYRYPHPALTADCVVFGFDGRSMYLLLIERGLEPYRGYWALPGGFMKIDESIEECALRELREETGVQAVMLRQLGVYSDPRRDPRERVVTVAFLALVSRDQVPLRAGDDAAAARWFLLSELPPLAFDHQRIVDDATRQLRRDLRLTDASFRLLGQTFSLTDIRRLLEWATGKPIDRRNFERKLLASGLVSQVNDDEQMPMCCCNEPEMPVVKCCAAPFNPDDFEIGAPPPGAAPRTPKARAPKRLFRFVKDLFNDAEHHDKPAPETDLDEPFF